MKYLIITVSILLVVSLAFGTTFTKSFDWFNRQIQNISTIANSVAGVSGGDFNSTLPIYLADINNANLQAYYDEETQKLYDVSDLIKMHLPTWLRTAYKDQVIVRVYPTFYSIKLGYAYNQTSSSATGGTYGNRKTYQEVYSINHSIRLNIETYYNSSTVIYDVFMFYDYIYNDVAFFCTKLGEEEGYKSYKLNSYNELINDMLIIGFMELFPPLNSKYIVSLDSKTEVKPDTMFIKYLYNAVTNVMDTTDPLWIDMKDFLPKGGL